MDRGKEAFCCVYPSVTAYGERSGIVEIRQWIKRRCGKKAGPRPVACSLQEFRCGDWVREILIGQKDCAVTRSDGGGREFDFDGAGGFGCVGGADRACAAADVGEVAIRGSGGGHVDVIERTRVDDGDGDRGRGVAADVDGAEIYLGRQRYAGAGDEATQDEAKGFHWQRILCGLGWAQE